MSDKRLTHVGFLRVCAAMAATVSFVAVALFIASHYLRPGIPPSDTILGVLGEAVFACICSTVAVVIAAHLILTTKGLD